MEALSAYLAHQSELQDIANDVIAAAQALLTREPVEWLEEELVESGATSQSEDSQLRLL
ncbi:MAG: hypothetical protein F6K28_58895 [Microcoleus sp. SIO2G3]|nr:hypothetical protein [Microcoleus sp. SIO2G3]